VRSRKTAAPTLMESTKKESTKTIRIFVHMYVCTCVHTHTQLSCLSLFFIQNCSCKNKNSSSLSPLSRLSLPLSRPCLTCLSLAPLCLPSLSPLSRLLLVLLPRLSLPLSYLSLVAKLHSWRHYSFATKGKNSIHGGTTVFHSWRHYRFDIYHFSVYSL